MNVHFGTGTRLTWRRVAALAMAVVFFQGLTAAFLHLDVREHYFCVEHARITHDADHIRAVEERLGTSIAFAETSSTETAPANSDFDGEPHDDESDDPECRWLTWLHDSPLLVPQVQPDADEPSLIGADLREARLESQTLHGRPIPTHHYSPNNSPPRG